MRFCSLASSDRQHAISAVTVAAPCGPVHHDDGGQWAAAASPLLLAALSARRTHHHHHQRGQQQQTPRATPQWPASASPKTHRACGCVCGGVVHNTATHVWVVRHPPRKAATTGGTPSSMYTSLEPVVLPAAVPLVEPARISGGRWSSASGYPPARSVVARKNGTKASRTHTRTYTHTHTVTHKTRVSVDGRRPQQQHTHTRRRRRREKRHERATHTLSRGRAVNAKEKKKCQCDFFFESAFGSARKI